MVTTEQKSAWRWFEVGLLVVGLATHLYIALSPANSLLHWYSTDDAFYYYKVAMNITSGHGVTFDGINPTNGFHPLWMLVCIPVFILGKINLILPLRVLVIVSALLSIGSGIFLFRLLKKFISNEVAAFIAVIWMFQPTIHDVVVVHGMESTISAFFIVAYVYFLVHWQDEEITTKRLIQLGVIGGLTVLARLDNIFIVLLLGGWFVLKPLGSYLRNLIASDIALIFITGMLSYYIRLRAGPFYQEYSISLSWFLILAFLFKPVLFFLFSRYQPDIKTPFINSLLKSLLAVTASSILLTLGLLLLHYFNVIVILPRSTVIVGQIIIIDWAGTLLGILGLQLFIGWFTSRSSEEDQTTWDLRSKEVWKALILRGFWFYLPVAILLGMFLLWSYGYTGAFMPVSGQIKHWWAGFSNTVYGAPITSTRQLFGVDKDLNVWKLASSYFTLLSKTVSPFFSQPMRRTAVLVFNILVAFLLIVFMILRRKWVANVLNRFGMFVLFLGLYTHIFYYTSTSYIHMRPWYWVGEIFFTMLLLGISLDSLVTLLGRWQFIKWGWNTAMLAIGAIVSFSFIQQNGWNFPYNVPVEGQEQYLKSTLFLEKRTTPGSLIGMTGGGTYAYFINDRTVVNLDGLINSNEYFESMKAGKGALFWDALGLDYVFATPYMVVEADPFKEMIGERLHPLVSGGGKTLYKYESTSGTDE